MSTPTRIVDPKTGDAAHVNERGLLSVSTTGYGPVPKYLTRHLRNSAGSEDANVNGSVTPVEFFVRPPPEEIWRIARMLVFVEDTKIIAAQYGNAGLLTNGVKLYIANDQYTLNDLLDGGTVNSNAEWAEYCFDAEAKIWGSGNEFLTVRWTFTKAGVPLRLEGSKRERLAVLIQDDLTGLDTQEFIVQGYRE
jgi:hypothetical protein